MLRRPIVGCELPLGSWHMAHSVGSPRFPGPFDSQLRPKKKACRLAVRKPCDQADLRAVGAPNPSAERRVSHENRDRQMAVF